MRSSAGLRLKTIILIAFMVAFGPLGDVLLRKGMKQIGAVTSLAPAALGRMFVRVITSPTIWAGIGLLLLFFVSYLLVLSWADYSYVQPSSSVGYAVVCLLGRFVLGETVSPTAWIGVVIICVGVFVVGHTHPRTTEAL